MYTRTHRQRQTDIQTDIYKVEEKKSEIMRERRENECVRERGRAINGNTHSH